MNIFSTTRSFWRPVLIVLVSLWTVSPGAAQQKLTKLRIGIIPVASLVTFYASEKLGYNREAGITLERKISPSSQVNATLMATGGLEVGLANSVDLIQILSKPFGFVILSDHERAQAKPPDTSSIFVRADSGINSVKDLVGKRITTTSLNNLQTLTANVVLKKHGVASNAVRWAEVPFPQMIPSLMSKQVDAAFLVEPFTTILLNNPKTKVIAWPFAEARPHFPIAQVYASRTWADANKQVTKNFVKALHRTIEFVKNPANRGKTNQFIVAFTRLKLELAAKLPMFG